MYSNLPYRTICIGNNNKKRRVGKPWWTNELSELWNRVCGAERKWINCNPGLKKHVLRSNTCQ